MKNLKMQSMTPKSALNPYRPLSGLRVFLLAALLVGWGAVFAETNLDDLASEGIEKIKQEKAEKEAAEAEKHKQAEEAKRQSEKEAADKAAAKKNEQAEAEHKTEPDAFTYLYAIPMPQGQAAASLKAKSDLASEKTAETKPSSLSGGYTINGDGTVTDTKTKLTWKQCSEGQSGKDCSGGKAEVYKWNDKVVKFGKNASFAGFNDWRMPTLEELQTLVYCSNGKAQDTGCDDNNVQHPTIDQQAFPNTPSAKFWSSSPFSLTGVNGAWYVTFDYGGTGGGTKSLEAHARLVRSDQ